MRKKLILINIVVLVLVIILYIYGINYPTNLNLWDAIKYSRLQYLVIALLFFVLVSWMVSTLKIKKLSSFHKFFLIFALLNSLLFSYLAFESGKIFILNKNAIAKIENQYINQAKEDIKHDNITYKFAGGFEVPRYDEKTIYKIDSIHKKYGITYHNTGCIIEEIESRGQEKYEETVQPYLDKRNGKGWQQRMDKEVEKLKKASKK